MSETAPISIPLAVSEEVMPNVEKSQVKKNIERKKHLCVVNVLKESVGATTITKCILHLRVNLTIGKLLASAPVIEKQLIKAISEDETVQFQVHALS